MGIDGAGLAIQNGFGSDGFDTWSAARDQRYDSSRAPAYVAPDMVGARDLDDYGTWESAPTYGPVWYPSTVAVGWAPYRFGYWTWVAPWGWTWVDAAPWGYAPFHYGRWVWLSGRWGWCPGAPIARATWAPALVGWYGGQGWVSAEGPVYGWVPLGWGDPYLPSWGRCSGRCYRQFNQPYAVAQTDPALAHAPQRYANSSVPGAITAVSAPVFSGARPVAPNQLGVGGLLAAIAPVMSAAPAVMPQPGTRLATPSRRSADAGRCPVPEARWQNWRVATCARVASEHRPDPSGAVVRGSADVRGRSCWPWRVHRCCTDARSESPHRGRSRHCSSAAATHAASCRAGWRALARFACAGRARSGARSSSFSLDQGRTGGWSQRRGRCVERADSQVTRPALRAPRDLGRDWGQCASNASRLPFSILTRSPSRQCRVSPLRYRLASCDCPSSRRGVLHSCPAPARWP